MRAILGRLQAPALDAKQTSPLSRELVMSQVMNSVNRLRIKVRTRGCREQRAVSRRGIRLQAAECDRSRARLAHSLRARPPKLEDYSVIHVAGTKGKGSTCAFVESILRHHGYKTGFYSSPHLIKVNERFRVNNAPVSDDLLVKHVHDTYEQLERTQNERGDNPVFPSFFRLLTMVAFKVFAEEKVDALVWETGMGGRLDATNVVPHPVVCGISLIDWDHMEVLGDTLGKIAREKAGILKPGSPAFTVEQNPEAAAVLQEVAKQVGIALPVVKPLSRSIRLGLDGDHQYQNAALAVHLAHTWLRRRRDPRVSDVLDVERLPDLFLRGLANASWEGRCQVLRLPAPWANVTFFIDGAHTEHSVKKCIEWFRSRSQALDADSRPRRHRNVLIWNIGIERDPLSLLRGFFELRLVDELDLVFICPFDADRPHARAAKSLDELLADNKLARPAALPAPDQMSAPRSPTNEWQYTQADAWQCLSLALTGAPSKPRVVVMESVEAATKWCQREGAELSGARVRVLVTGSLYLVGNVLSKLYSLGAAAL
jgi:folylpolyglutamate synthase